MLDCLTWFGVRTEAMLVGPLQYFDGSAIVCSSLQTSEDNTDYCCLKEQMCHV